MEELKMILETVESILRLGDRLVSGVGLQPNHPTRYGVGARCFNPGHAHVNCGKSPNGQAGCAPTNPVPASSILPDQRCNVPDSTMARGQFFGGVQ